MNADAYTIVADATTRILADLADPQTINAATDDAWKAPLWTALEEAGLTLAWVDEACGGAGAGLDAGFEVLRAAGQYAAPAPVAETLLAGWLLAEAGLDCPVGPMTIAPLRDGDKLLRTPQGGITGVARAVPFGAEARHVALLAEDDGAEIVALVAAEEISAAPRPTDMGGARADLTLDQAMPLAIAPLQGGGEALRRMGAAARACQMTGALETVLDVSTRYTTERVAFGRPLAKFQAVQQSLARLGGEVAAALAASGSAADALANGAPDGELLLEVASAKIRCGEAVATGAAIAHQAHGAIGFTAEHVLQRFSRAMWGWRDDFGSEAIWAVALGEAVASAGAHALWPLLTTR